MDEGASSFRGERVFCLFRPDDVAEDSATEAGEADLFFGDGVTSWKDRSRAARRASIPFGVTMSS